METEFGDEAKIAQLPQSGVHCFPGSAKKITRNRVISALLFVAFAAACVVCIALGNANGKGDFRFFAAGVLCGIGAMICVLVFCQTFLVAKYRVAVDYNQKTVVLRYRYSNISIPFENFDGREGTPDEAEAIMDKNFSKGKNEYFVLDDVFQNACYQTSVNDLESREDFNKLKQDCLDIADAYGARNSEDKVKFFYEKEDTNRSTEDVDIDKIIETAKTETGEGSSANQSDDK